MCLTVTYAPKTKKDALIVPVYKCFDWDYHFNRLVTPYQRTTLNNGFLYAKTSLKKPLELGDQIAEEAVHSYYTAWSSGWDFVRKAIAINVIAYGDVELLGTKYTEVASEILYVIGVGGEHDEVMRQLWDDPFKRDRNKILKEILTKGEKR